MLDMLNGLINKAPVVQGFSCHYELDCFNSSGGYVMTREAVSLCVIKCTK